MMDEETIYSLLQDGKNSAYLEIKKLNKTDRIVNERIIDYVHRGNVFMINTIVRPLIKYELHKRQERHRRQLLLWIALLSAPNVISFILKILSN